MKRLVRPTFSILAACAVLTMSRDPRGARADGDAEKARRATVVARIGARVITTAELEDRLAAVPRFQLATFGNSPDAIRRKFLEDILVPEVLYADGAEDKHLDAEPLTEHQLLRARSNATLRVVRAQIGPATAIPLDDVKKYYEANRSKYESPERINVWRILCKTKEEAIGVLADAKKDPTIATFTSLARDHSLDKATSMRGGNLGFLGPDGASNEAGLKADPVLVRAAQRVKDGEFAPLPIPEGEYFAIVWRRGTVGATHKTLEEVASQIRDVLWKEKKEQAEKRLLDDLRARDVSQLNPALIDTIEISTNDGAVLPRRRPGQVPPLTPAPPK